MLVLTRKRNQMIQIGDNVTIKVVHLSKGCVKIGISAPSDVRVLRAELCERDAAENPEMGESDLCPTMAVSDQFPHPCVA